MAQAETRPTSTIVGGATKLRIKLKLPVGAKKQSGSQTGGTSSTGNQLADLHAAVEAFCQQGLRGLPGAVLLSPWREPSPIEQLAQQQQQQVDGFSLPGLQQPLSPGLQQQLGPPSRRRVRKRREPEPAMDDFAAFDMHHVAWGSIKRRRSSNHRARDAARLSNSIHSMLQTIPAGQGSPASPSVVSQPQAEAAAHSRPASDGGVNPAAQQPSRLHRASAPGAAAAGSVQAGPAPVAMAPLPPAATTALREPASAPEPAGAVAINVDELNPAAVGAPPAAAVSKAAQPGAGPHQQQQQQQQIQKPEVGQNPPQPEAKQGEPKQHRLQQQYVQQQQALEAHKQQQQQQQPLQPVQKQVQRQTQQNTQQIDQIAGQVQQEQKHAQQEQKAQQLAAVQPAQPTVIDISDAQLACAPVADAAIAQAATAAAPAAVQDQKPDSPPSETSQQQRIGSAVQQHLQELLPKTAPPQPSAPEQQQQPQQEQTPELQGEVLQQPKQPEQTAVSRDRSQCSLQRAQEAPRGPAAVSMPAPAAVPVPLLAPAAAGGSGRLLELATATMTPAAGALASLSAVPEVRQRVLPPEDVPVRTQEEALRYLSTIMDKAKYLKHSGDKRNAQLGAWDVFGLSFYALGTVEFLMYWDTANRLLNKLRAQEQPVERLQQQISSLSNAQFLRQTGQLSTTAMNICSNCKGPDVAKQALRMLLERLSAISNLRNLHNQRKQLESHIRVLKSNGASLGNGSSSGNAIRTAQQQQQAQYVPQGQQQARVQLQHTAAGKPPSPGGSSWSPAGQQNFNKRSPDDSNTSNQERLQLPVGAEHGSGAVGASAGGAVAGAGGHAAALQAERALALAKSERALLDSMQELLKMTDGMHQTVMRMQQFLESPDVLASEHARAAALHISVLGLDAGMFSIPRVAAHTEAAVTCLTKLLRSGS